MEQKRDGLKGDKRMLVRYAIDLWFDPKSFESRKLYEILGIRRFKKYVPTTGDLMNRYLWRSRKSSSEMRASEMLRFQVVTTKVIESIHMGIFVWLCNRAAEEFSSGRIDKGIFTSLLNIYVNVYPIMLQRYNCIRYLKAIEQKARLGEKFSDGGNGVE